MKENIKDKFITNSRLKNYNNFDEYKQNLYKSEEYYILLSIFEISLRNSIDNYFKIQISSDWLDSDILQSDTKQKIKEVKNKLLKRKETITHDKIIADLSFGFWTSFFRKSYSKIMRLKDINNIFPNIFLNNDKLINRNIIATKLNHIRIFRNRVFHYERIINKSEYKNMEDNIFKFLAYFDAEIYSFAKDMINKN